MAEFVISSYKGQVCCAIDYVGGRRRESSIREWARLPLTEEQCASSIAELEVEFSPAIEKVKIQIEAEL